MDTILRAKHRGIPQNDINFALLWGKMMSTPILVLSKASFLSQGNSLNYTKYSFMTYYRFFAAIFSFEHQLDMVNTAQYFNKIFCAKCQARSTLFDVSPNCIHAIRIKANQKVIVISIAPYAPEKHVETGFGYFRDFYLLWLCPAVQYFVITSGELLKKTPKNRSGLVTPRVIHPGCCARLRSTPCCSPPFTFRLYRMIYTASTKIASEYWYSYCR